MSSRVFSLSQRIFSGTWMYISVTLDHGIAINAVTEKLAGKIAQRAISEAIRRCRTYISFDQYGSQISGLSGVSSIYKRLVYLWITRQNMLMFLYITRQTLLDVPTEQYDLLPLGCVYISKA